MIGCEVHVAVAVRVRVEEMWYCRYDASGIVVIPD